MTEVDLEGAVDALPDEVALDGATTDENHVGADTQTTPETGGETTSGTEGADALEGDEGDDAGITDEEKETRSQRRRRQRREYVSTLEQDAARLARENERLKDKLEGLQAPDADDFENPDDYTAARASYETRKATIEDQLADVDEGRKGLDQASEAVRADAFKDASAEARKVYADYDKVALGEHWKPTPVMMDVILESDRSADLAYYLGAHPGEADRIARLAPARQAAELGRIEATKLPAPKSKVPPQSKAPEPIKPIRAAGATADKSPQEMSYEEYTAWRKGKTG